MIEKMRHAERRAEETYPPPSDRASVPLGQRNVQLRAGYVQGYLDRDSEEPFDEQRPDPRAVMHAKCNCVPSLGPAHCHKCGENQGSPVPWTECTAVRSVVPEIVRQAHEYGWDQGRAAGLKDALETNDSFCPESCSHAHLVIPSTTDNPYREQ